MVRFNPRDSNFKIPKVLASDLDPLDWHAFACKCALHNKVCHLLEESIYIHPGPPAIVAYSSLAV